MRVTSPRSHDTNRHLALPAIDWPGRPVACPGCRLVNWPPAVACRKCGAELAR